MEISTIDICYITITIISIVVSIFLFIRVNKLLKHYNAITKNVNGRNLEEILNEHLKRIEENINKVDNLQKSYNKLKEDGNSHFQKVGFKRFNPFLETGGNQSFILAILNLNNDGFIISSLHQRDATRVYAKQIEKGKAKNKLSKEELDVLNKMI